MADSISAPIETAPRDGSVVVLDLGRVQLSAFWCKDLQRWVLCQPLHMESVYEPKGWFPDDPKLGS